jgi:hypothetical protein
VPSREEKASDAFFALGSQYFVHARYSAQFFYLPVSATLFHHAVEMLLKGSLSRRVPTIELKRIGHDLVRLWSSFKQEAGDPALARYDRAVSLLDEVERLRYPDTIVDEGYVLLVSLGPTVTPLDLPGADVLPHYAITVSDLDAIVLAIFRGSGVSPIPYFKGAPGELKRGLPIDLCPSDEVPAA